MNLELSRWGDGTIRLYFEDWQAGRDRLFILHDDGHASEAFTQEDDSEVLTAVDLVAQLRAMVE